MFDNTLKVVVLKKFFGPIFIIIMILFIIKISQNILCIRNIILKLKNNDYLLL